MHKMEQFEGSFKLRMLHDAVPTRNKAVLCVERKRFREPLVVFGPQFVRLFVKDLWLQS